MVYTRIEQRVFSQGELGPYMLARYDSKMFLSGLLKSENWVTLPQGSLFRRAGFYPIGEVMITSPIVEDLCSTGTPVDLIINDSFTADSSTLDAHAGESGVQWINAYTSYNATATGTIKIDSNVANGNHAVAGNYGGIYVTTSSTLDGADKIASPDIVGPGTANFLAQVDLSFLSIVTSTQAFALTASFDATHFGRLLITGTGGEYFVHAGNSAPIKFPYDVAATYTLNIQSVDGRTCYYIKRITDGYWFNGSIFDAPIHSTYTHNTITGQPLSLVKYSDGTHSIYNFCSLQIGMYPNPQVMAATNFKVYSL